MSENRCSCNSGGASSVGRDGVCIDTYRVLDSCRDKDCYENVRVYLNNGGQDLIDRFGSSVRVVCAKILWTYLSVDPIRFNRGFYQINARIYVHLRLEACTGMGRSQEFCGIAVLDKKVILYGGEGNVNIYRSDPEANRCTPWNGSIHTTNMPIGVMEAVEPVVLGSTVVEPRDACGCNCYTCCTCDDIPGALVEDCALGQLTDGGEGNSLYVSLGLFTVFRIERPAQLLVNATDYSVPEKECKTDDPCNPCALFRSMSFPTGEFTGEGTGCNCDKGRRT